MFPQFRSQYPQGTIQTEMLPKQEGKFIFRATISLNQNILSTATAWDTDLEAAEDKAVQRALTFAGISISNSNATPALPSYQSNHTDSYSTYSAPEIPLFEHNNNNNNNSSSSPEDLSDEITKTTVEMERLGWTSEQGKEYLMRTFGKKSRHQLTPSELRQFLLFLQSQPSHRF